MAGMTPGANGWSRSPLRKAMWGAAAAMLLWPAVAMRFTTEVNWTASDFVFMGVLLGAAGGAVEFGMRLSRDPWHRAGMAAAAGGAFLLVWVNAAVGLIGSENNPANLLYLGVIAIALLGSILARFRPRGMALAMLAALAAHLAIGVAALVAGWGGPSSTPVHVLGVTGVFAMPWLTAAALFHVASRTPSAAGMAD